MPIKFLPIEEYGSFGKNGVSATWDEQLKKMKAVLGEGYTLHYNSLSETAKQIVRDLYYVQKQVTIKTVCGGQLAVRWRCLFGLF